MKFFEFLLLVALVALVAFILGCFLSFYKIIPYLIFKEHNFPFWLKKRIRKMRNNLLATVKREVVSPELTDFGNTDKTFLFYYPVTVVFSLRKVGVKSPEHPVIKSISPKANQFYGCPSESHELINQDASFLMEKIRSWMNPEDYQAFIEDQQRLITDCLSKDIKQDKMFAKIPVIFNNEHPHDSYRGKTFLPIIVFIKEDKYGITVEDSFTILYLDLDSLPKDLILSNLQKASKQ